MRETLKKGSLSDLLGGRFEEVLKIAFPQIEKLDKSADNNPDFSFDSTFGKLLIEAKTAYGGHHYIPTTGSLFIEPRPGDAYGAQIKEYQRDAFTSKESHGESIVYAVGYHGIYQSKKRIGPIQTKIARTAFIRRNFISPSLYFVSHSIVKSFFDVEKRLSDKARELINDGEELPSNDPGWYASLKPTNIRQICDAVQNKRFKSYIKRDGVGVELFGHYGLNQDELVAQSLGFTQTHFAFNTKKGPVPIRVGYVVEKRQEKQILDLLSPNTTL